MTEASPISKEPPRVWINAEAMARNGSSMATVNGHVGDERYLSLTEHQALLVAARREARAGLMEELKREGKILE